MRRNQKGFTLMELMVVIIIVAILAAVAVPLYINYVRDAQRTEARGAIGAVITAEQTYFQQTGVYLNYSNAQFTTPPTPPAPVLNVDLTDALKNWTFDVTNATNSGFLVTAGGLPNTPAANLNQTLTYSRTAQPIWNP